MSPRRHRPQCGEFVPFAGFVHARRPVGVRPAAVVGLQQVDVVEVEPLRLVDGEDADRFLARVPRSRLLPFALLGDRRPQRARHALDIGPGFLHGLQETAEEPFEVRDPEATERARRLRGLQ